MLSPHRVLDLTDERGWLAGFLLAQLGADVVLAEPDGGRKRNVWHEAYNRGKRSVTVESVEDLAALARAADVVIDCGAMPFAVDAAALREANPALITVSLTPFGETGPKADWLATDITLFAASGQLGCTGDPDRPPVRTTLPQAWLHACADSAVAALVALHERETSGLGQHVDVSAQQAVAGAALPAILHGPAGLAPQLREAGGMNMGAMRLRWVHPARDGDVLTTIAFGPMIGPFVTRLLGWMCEEDFCDEATRDKDWIDFPLRLQSGEESFEELDRLTDLISKFLATKTKAELAEAAIERGLLIAPVNTLSDVLDSPQLMARDYWEEVEGICHPGAMVKASKTPLPTLPRAPDIGEHTAAVRSTWTALTRRPASAPPDRPLEGLNVVDLSWVAATPLATRVLAYWGATVVRIESVHRPDLARGALGHRDDIPEQENAITWHAANAGKLGLALNLAKPEAREVVRDLACWGDLLIESFTPGTMSDLGLGYEELRQLNPRLVMLSSCVMGQSGPLASLAGFGNMAAAVAGFTEITGWPDRPPAGPFMAYTDFTSPRFLLCSVLAAIDHQRRTGVGQYLDFSQMEAATHFLTPALLEAQQSGYVLTRAGNTDANHAPHGVYPSCKDDDWVAIACESDEQWRSLAIEMRRSDLADLTAKERLERRDELDEIVAAWTANQDAAGLPYRLQAHGVPAHQVLNGGTCLSDPQLLERGHLQWAPHPEARKVLVDIPPYKLSRSDGAYDWGGPTYGQHAMQVLGDLLGYDGDRIAELAIAEALE